MLGETELSSDLHAVVSLCLGFRIVQVQPGTKDIHSRDSAIGINDGSFPPIFTNSFTKTFVDVNTVLESTDFTVGRVGELIPLGWELTDCVPNLLDITDHRAHTRMMLDLPEHGQDDSTDVVLESLVGAEFCASLLATSRKNIDFADKPTHALSKSQIKILDIRRRVLLVRWLYIHNFIGEEFPNSIRFVSDHFSSLPPQSSKVLLA
jgi:hypothetical protein